MRLAGAGLTAEEERADPGRLRHELVDEAPRPGQRARLARAVGAVAVQRAVEELERKTEPGEQRQPSRIGAARTAPHHRIAALVGGEDASLTAASGAGPGVRASLGHRAPVLDAEDRSLAAAARAASRR